MPSRQDNTIATDAQEPFEHLNTLRLSFAHESDRLRREHRPSVRHWRQANLDIIGREIDGEIAFLAKRDIVEPPIEEMTDDELLAALR